MHSLFCRLAVPLPGAFSPWSGSSPSSSFQLSVSTLLPLGNLACLSSQIRWDVWPASMTTTHCYHDYTLLLSHWFSSFESIFLRWFQQYLPHTHLLQCDLDAPHHHKWSLLLFLLSLGRACGCFDWWNTPGKDSASSRCGLWSSLAASTSCLLEVSSLVKGVMTLRPVFWKKPTQVEEWSWKKRHVRKETEAKDTVAPDSIDMPSVKWLFQAQLPSLTCMSKTWTLNCVLPTHRPIDLWADKHGCFKPLSFQIICLVMIDNWKICFDARKEMWWIFKALSGVKKDFYKYLPFQRVNLFI